eukprot:gene57222-biopygen12482
MESCAPTQSPLTSAQTEHPTVPPTERTEPPTFADDKVCFGNAGEGICDAGWKELSAGDIRSPENYNGFDRLVREPCAGQTNALCFKKEATGGYCKHNIHLATFEGEDIATAARCYKAAAAYRPATQAPLPGSVSFVKGANVDNAAYNSAGCGTWYGTLEEAKERCINDPACVTLHDFNDNFGHLHNASWRACTGYMQPGGDEKAAMYTVVRPGAITFERGPNVHNGAYTHAECGDWLGTFSDAVKRCSADTTCTTLHDWNGDGYAWRTCKHHMVEGGDKKAVTYNWLLYTIVRWGAHRLVKGPRVDNSYAGMQRK